MQPGLLLRVTIAVSISQGPTHWVSARTRAPSICQITTLPEMRQLNAELEPARQRRQRPLVQAVHMWAGALIESCSRTLLDALIMI